MEILSRFLWEQGRCSEDVYEQGSRPLTNLVGHWLQDGILVRQDAAEYERHYCKMFNGYLFGILVWHNNNTPADQIFSRTKTTTRNFNTHAPTSLLLFLPPRRTTPSPGKFSVNLSIFRITPSHHFFSLAPRLLPWRRTYWHHPGRQSRTNFSRDPTPWSSRPRCRAKRPSRQEPRSPTGQRGRNW